MEYTSQTHSETYLQGCHVGNTAMRLHRLELIQTPIQLVDRIQSQLHIRLVPGSVCLRDWCHLNIVSFWSGRKGRKVSMSNRDICHDADEREKIFIHRTFPSPSHMTVPVVTVKRFFSRRHYQQLTKTCFECSPSKEWKLIATLPSPLTRADCFQNISQYINERKTCWIRGTSVHVIANFVLIRNKYS